ncbi:MAG: DMT family transporter [Candidatus Micrarchaeota archaeon]|nr:DMT family transporter [Candidatus Micrarchaeota archaeon]
MLEILFVLGTALCFGIADVVTKKSITDAGMYKSAAYGYVILVALILLGALVIGIEVPFPKNVITYLVQIIIGATAVLALFKAFEEGKASILAPLTKLNVLIVLIFGTVILGEKLTGIQFTASVLIVGSAFILSFSDLKNFKLEKGVMYILITIFGWGYYYSFFKTFVAELGAYQAIFLLEIGVATVVILYCILMKKDLSLPPLGDWKYIGARSATLFIGTVLYSVSVNVIGAGVSAAIIAGSPVITAILAYQLLGEKLDNYKYAAIVVMVTGLVLMFLFG